MHSLRDATVVELDPFTSAILVYVNSQKIGLLQSFIESYEGLGIVRTLDENQGLVSILCQTSSKDEIMLFLSSVKDRFQISPAPLPQEEYSRYLSL